VRSPIVAPGVRAESPASTGPEVMIARNVLVLDRFHILTKKFQAGMQPAFMAGALQSIAVHSAAKLGQVYRCQRAQDEWCRGLLLLRMRMCSQ
jgi:hypothetical protein